MPRSSVDPKTGLTQKQERFSVLFVTGGPEFEGNATACYRAAFDCRNCKPVTINARGRDMLKKGTIQARIAVLRNSVAEKAGITAAEVLEIAANMARAATLAEFYTDDGKIKPPSEWTPAMKIAAAQMKTFEEYEGRGDERELVGYVKEIKIWDRNPAIERLFKHFGLFEKDNKQQGAQVIVVPAKNVGTKNY